MRPHRVWTSTLSVFLATASLFFAGFSGLMGRYFVDKYFGLYRPNKQAIDECIPSGSCSLDGLANLEVSGLSGLICMSLTLGSLGLGLWLPRGGMASG